MVNILSSDLLIADVIVPLKGEPPDSPVRKLLAEYQAKGLLQPDSKLSLGDDEAEFKRIAGIIKIEGRPIYPGGSSSNMLYMLSHLMGKAANVDFWGVAGPSGGKKDNPDTKIRNSLASARINLLPLIGLPAAAEQKSALSFVFQFENGKRAIVTYPGNAKELLQPSMINDAAVEKSNIVVVQGSLWQKLKETETVSGTLAPPEKQGFADTLMRKRWDEGKELWLAMPTQAEFGKTPHTAAEKTQHFQWLIRSANLVLGNGEELSRVYTKEEEHEEIAEILARCGVTKDDLKDQKVIEAKVPADERAKYDIANKSIHAEEALKRLHEEFSAPETALMTEHKAGRWKGKTHQLGFITLGMDGAAVVSREGIRKVPITELEEGTKVISTLGSGDASFGAFGAAYLAMGGDKKELSLADAELCAKFGMLMAREKIQIPSARLDDPYGALKKVALSQTDPARSLARIMRVNFEDIRKESAGLPRRFHDFARSITQAAAL